MHCQWSRTPCLSPRFRRAQRANKPSALRDWARTQITLVASVGYADRRSLGDAHVFVSCAVVKEKVVFLLRQLHHALNKNYIGYLADLLPFFFWDEDGGVGTGEEPAGIV